VPCVAVATDDVLFVGVGVAVGADVGSGVAVAVSADVGSGVAVAIGADVGAGVAVAIGAVRGFSFSRKMGFGFDGASVAGAAAGGAGVIVSVFESNGRLIVFGVAACRETPQQSRSVSFGRPRWA
jgi:hypothetical protein